MSDSLVPRPSSLEPLLWLDQLQGSGIRPGLGRMRALLGALGNPHRAYPSILVAGTNGKGSTSAMLTSILNESGRRAAHYTSPHLVSLNERWTVAGQQLDPTEAIVELQKASARRHRADVFRSSDPHRVHRVCEAKCDIAVLEVGMGGRLDATNVIKPIAAVIRRSAWITWIPRQHCARSRSRRPA
jgi:dihydrofolate synthase/folylpolyglutamate synthase